MVPFFVQGTVALVSRSTGAVHSEFANVLNGACVHYVMVSKIQWKPFWLATHLYPQSRGSEKKFFFTTPYTEWLDWVAKWCELCMTFLHRPRRMRVERCLHARPGGGGGGGNGHRRQMSYAFAARLRVMTLMAACHQKSTAKFRSELFLYEFYLVLVHCTSFEGAVQCFFLFNNRVLRLPAIVFYFSFSFCMCLLHCKFVVYESKSRITIRSVESKDWLFRADVYAQRFQDIQGIPGTRPGKLPECQPQACRSIVDSAFFKRFCAKLSVRDRRVANLDKKAAAGCTFDRGKASGSFSVLYPSSCITIRSVWLAANVLAWQTKSWRRKSSRRKAHTAQRSRECM